jgi:hypothetical protein
MTSSVVGGTVLEAGLMAPCSMSDGCRVSGEWIPPTIHRSLDTWDRGGTGNWERRHIDEQWFPDNGIALAALGSAAWIGVVAASVRPLIRDRRRRAAPVRFLPWDGAHALRCFDCGMSSIVPSATRCFNCGSGLLAPARSQ